MKRRRFVRLAGAAAMGTLPLPEWLRGGEGEGAGLRRTGGVHTGSLEDLAPMPDEIRLVILHTNDTHSRIDPFPMDGGPFQGLGGVARRMSLIRRVRDHHPNVLVLDSGDIFQGTPYFNFFGGEIEFASMSAMGYDAATLGNHDFDNGVEGLAAVMPLAEFDFVSANYDVEGSPLEARVRPWVIHDVGGVRVGIFGLGVAFEGLVLPPNHLGARYTDPLVAAHRSVTELRERGCSLVTCLSHLGYRYRGDQPSDTVLAREVEGIDLILGGHSHTFMDEPDVYVQADGRSTLVNQVGWGGMRLGRVDVVMGPVPRESLSAGAHTPRRWATGGYRVDHTLD